MMSNWRTAASNNAPRGFELGVLRSANAASAHIGMMVCNGFMWVVDGVLV